MDRDEVVEALREKVQRLEDLEEIRQLYIDYGRHLDDGDPVAYAALFARQAKLRLGPVARADGSEEIERAAASIARRSPDEVKHSVHLLGSPRIELSGESMRRAPASPDRGQQENRS